MDYAKMVRRNQKQSAQAPLEQQPVKYVDEEYERLQQKINYEDQVAEKKYNQPNDGSNGGTWR